MPIKCVRQPGFQNWGYLGVGHPRARGESRGRSRPPPGLCALLFSACLCPRDLSPCISSFSPTLSRKKREGLKHHQSSLRFCGLRLHIRGALFRKVIQNEVGVGRLPAHGPLTGVAPRWLLNRQAHLCATRVLAVPFSASSPEPLLFSQELCLGVWNRKPPVPSHGYSRMTSGAIGPGGGEEDTQVGAVG